MWFRYLEGYPDYMTKGESMEEIKENLKEVCRELVSGAIPSVRRVIELAVA